MRADLFEELAPVCPRCLHGGAGAHPLQIAAVAETRSGLIWHAIVHCSNPSCWAEFPVIDGVPVIVPDPSTFVRNASDYLLWRADLPPLLESCLADGFGPGHGFDTMRHHLSIYASDHFADWGVGGETSCIADVTRTGLSAFGLVDGPMIELGGGVGRGAWELAALTSGPVLSAEFNIAMLRLSQRLMLEGEATFSRRRVGIVYDPVTVTLPEEMASDRVDFWAMDAMALPFPDGRFGMASAINIIDCIAGPTELVAETARVLTGGGAALFTTPYDWAGNSTEPMRWMGGHSQRAAHQGAAEPVLRATLEQFGLKPIAEETDIPWRLTLHARSVMHYQLHMLACRKG